MMPELFYHERIYNNNPKWSQATKRETEIYKKKDEIRSEFERDYNRILHCNAYRRLKHKTQVFFATNNDHICTRIEHVNHVKAVSYTISKFLGLNTELTNAIAIGHDLGHAPFGHSGEVILHNISKKEINKTFWHEMNSLRVIDDIETLQNGFGKEKNLNLCYAIRDGIVMHCGEVDENGLYPRAFEINLKELKKANEFAPFTWEGCIVKISDKIAYLGRDIEDAIRLNILSDIQLQELKSITKTELHGINNTVLMHDFITDLCKNSTPEQGIKFSNQYLELMALVKEFNYKNIYNHKRLQNYVKYAELIINSIFSALNECFNGIETLKMLNNIQTYHPKLSISFSNWLMKYSNLNSRNDELNKYENFILYNIENKQEYQKAIIDYIAGITDHFAIGIFEELTQF